MIEKVNRIGGSTGPVRKSNRITIGPAAGPDLQFTAYTTAYNSLQAHTFAYPGEKLATVFKGALMQLVVPVGAMEPFTWDSSNIAVAEIARNGVIQWYDAGSVTFTLTDANGLIAKAVFSPGKLFRSLAAQTTWTQAADLCEKIGGRQPAARELTNGGFYLPAERQVGTLVGEWGDLTHQSWPYSPIGLSMWSADPNTPEGYFTAVYFTDGSLTKNIGSYRYYGAVCVLEGSENV